MTLTGARIDGQVVFVHRAVRGEVCDILVLKVLKNAAFGKVVEGMEVVKKILVLPVDPNKGTGAMKGEILKAPVRIQTARRV